MFNPNARASDPARENSLDASTTSTGTPLSVAIVSDDHATVQALVSACEFMLAFESRLRVAALHDDPAHMRAQPNEVLILDAANAHDRRVDPAHYPASPCVVLIHDGASPDEAACAAQAHASLLCSQLSPAALELAIRTAQQNWRALTVARRTIEFVERSALTARDGQRRILEEIGPIAHALEGLLDIMSAEEATASGGPTPTQLNLLRNWTRDLVRTVGRHQDAAAIPAGARADMTSIVEDAVALFRSKCDALGHTVVLSSPSEPVTVAAEPRRLRAAVIQLMESVFDRESRDRRIDIVHWRSMDESRLAFVSGPPVRRGLDATETIAPPVRTAGVADERFIGALAQLRELGAVVETSCANAFGTSLLVSLPVA